MLSITGDKPVVVLITVNDHETDALLDVFLGPGQSPAPVQRGGVTYHELGLHGGMRVIHSLCEMGAGGIGAAQQRAQDAVDHWQPRAVIAVGIAFGIDEAKQSIGDVLVSVQLQDYELARVSSDGTLTPRGDKPHASDTLVNRFRQTDVRFRRSEDNWPKIRFGLVLSGQKLIDNLDYRESLKLLWSEAIGGEMEGTGVYTSAQRARVDWIVVKAICDWGHNKNQADKDTWQKTAACNAARVVKSALDAGDLYPLEIAKSPRSWNASDQPTPDNDGDQRATEAYASLVARVFLKAPAVSLDCISNLDEPNLVHPETRSNFATCSLSPKPSFATLSEIFSNASKRLRDWPKTFANGHWEERPELVGLMETIRNELHSSRFIVGKPGTGKSALLSQLICRLTSDGVASIGIKADSLPVEIDSLEKLSMHLLGNDQTDLVDMLRKTALEHKIVVLIDQLDALASLADLRTERLNVLLDFISQVRGCHGIHLVCSMREFELGYDRRLKGLVDEKQNDVSERLDLPGFSKEQVIQLLQTQISIDARNWQDHHLSFLEIPYHLAQFTRHYEALNDSSTGHVRFFANIQGVHQSVFNCTVATSRNRDFLNVVLTKMTEKIEKTESLWHEQDAYGLKAIDERYVMELEGQGWILRQEDGKISFAHQTQFEFMLGRKFSFSPDEFVDYVQERQDGLFVRPTVWYSLALMRTEGNTNYERAIELLLDRVERRHLKRLFIEFLAEVEEPTEKELGWVEKLLVSETDSARMCWLIRGKRGWFEKLSDNAMDYLMMQPAEKAWHVCRLLEGSWSLKSERTKNLLRRYWAYRREYVGLMWFILSQAEDFDYEMYLWLLFCAMEQSDTEKWYVSSVVKNLAKANPEWSFGLVSTVLHRRMDNAGEINPSEFIEVTKPSERRKARGAISACIDVYSKELTSSIWYSVLDVASNNPGVFVGIFWPWILRMHQLSKGWKSTRVHAFRHSFDQLRFYPDQQFANPDFGTVLRVSMEKWAEKEPERFVEFLMTHGSVDAYYIQSFFLHCLSLIADQVPDFILAFLRNDSRRLAFIIPSRSIEVKKLLDSVIPAWTPKQRAEFQEYVLGWEMYMDHEDVPETERNRAEILQIIPVEMRSQAAAKLVEKYSNSLRPETQSQQQAGEAEICMSLSSVSSKQMTGLSTHSLLTRIRKSLVECSQSGRGGDWEQDDLVREFRNFLIENSERILEIAQELRLPQDGRLAAEALSVFATDDREPQAILKLVRDWINLDFSCKYFWHSLGWVLRDVAIRGNGLPDDVLQYIANVLKTAPIDTVDDEPNANIASIKGEKTRFKSILWDGEFIDGVYPHVWFSLGDALRLGYCLRKDKTRDSWHSHFIALVDRPFPIKVWKFWLLEMLSFNPNRVLISKLVELLITKEHKVMRSTLGIWAVAKLGTSIKAEIRESFLVKRSKNKDKRIRQAFGELAVVLHVRDNDPSAARLFTPERLTKYRGKVTTRAIGIAFGVANAWRWKEARPACLEIMTSMLPTESVKITNALLWMFNLRGDVFDDSITKDLLELFAECVSFSKAENLFGLVMTLKDYVLVNPELTYRVLRRIVDGLRESTTGGALHQIGAVEDDLINTVLTIHRSSPADSDLRRDSLTLYEDLLDLEVNGAFIHLRKLDQRPS